MIKILKVLFVILLVFNVLNTVITLGQDLFGPVIQFVFDMPFPFAVQKRSLLSFFILSFLSYYCLIRFYNILNLQLKPKKVALIFFIMSVWFQFLSVQYVGIVSSPYTVKKSDSHRRAIRIVEYYSIFGFPRGDFIENDECYDLIQNFNDEKKFLKCKTDLNINLFEKTIFKKYRISQSKSIYVLDGIGPFFTLSVFENTFDH